MEVDSHSVTAVMVAAIRAYHSAGPQPRIFDDTLARLLLSPAECEAYEGTCVKVLQRLDPSLAASCSNRAAFIHHVMRLGVGAATVLVRARYMEEALFEAIHRGVRQYVVIGAGLDTFAFRRPDIGDRLRVIEVDHPATQALKRERLASASLVPPAHLYFAAADLERESVSAALARTPYDSKTPAFFAWPGVTMYLTREAIFATLRSIGTAAAYGSELVFDYFEPGAFAADAPLRVRLMLQHVQQLGEPMVSGLDPATLEVELSSVGFRMVEDLGPRQVQVRFLDGTDGFHAVEHWHLARTAIATA
jgi:methyltransferase (TIGR00027 family)